MEDHDVTHIQTACSGGGPQLTSMLGLEDTPPTMSYYRVASQHQSPKALSKLDPGWTRAAPYHFLLKWMFIFVSIQLWAPSMYGNRLLILQDANVCSPAEGLILVYFVSVNCWWVVPKIYKWSTYVQVMYQYFNGIWPISIPSGNLT